MSNGSVNQWLAYSANDLADAAHEANTSGNRCAHAQLTKWYVEGRYPNGETATTDDASRMLLVAREIYNSITADIRLRSG